MTGILFIPIEVERQGLRTVQTDQVENNFMVADLKSG